VIILAIDPGTVQSAWLAFDTTVGRPLPGQFRIEPNADLLERLRGWQGDAGVIVIEQIASYGMAVGDSTFETVHWAGRFAEAAYPTPVYRVLRKAVTLNLCHSTRANDSNVRRALLDRFGGDSAIGRKASPGPLYGFHSHLFAALGVAVTFADMEPDVLAAARLP